MIGKFGLSHQINGFFFFFPFRFLFAFYIPYPFDGYENALGTPHSMSEQYLYIYKSILVAVQNSINVPKPLVSYLYDVENR
jgi:hypothetical protein